MKRLLFLLLTIPSLAFSQQESIDSFYVENSGNAIAKKGEENKDFIIREFPNLSSSDLYKAISIGIEKISSDSKRTTQIEGSLVTVEDIKKYYIKVPKTFNSFTTDVYYDLSFRMTFEVKDGKVRISKVKALSYTTEFKYVDKDQKILPYYIASYHLKKSDEELNDKTAQFFNQYINAVLKEVETYSEW